MPIIPPTRWLALLTTTALIAFGQPRMETPEVEGSFHGFPELRDLQGRKLADGEFLQSIEDGRLRIKNSYDFGRDHRVEETALFRLEPFAQEAWSWRESRDGQVQREYSVDLRTGQARAMKIEEGKSREWSEQLELEPGRTFAGVGFTTAIKKFRGQLMRGETIELRAIGFTPKPRAVTVKISHAGVDEMTMAGRRVQGDRFVIQPKIPAVARWLLKLPDTRIWLTHPAPAGFLRWEGPFAEATESVVRVDLLPGDPSGPAEPLKPGAEVTPTGR